MGAVAEGIRYAAANGARIINLSLGGPTRDPWLAEAVKAAAAANVLVICSAGNEGDQHRPQAGLPGVDRRAERDRRGGDGRRTTGAQHRRLLQLRQAHRADRRARRGGAVDVERRRLRVRESGTSMAAPHATGVAALMAAVAPGRVGGRAARDDAAGRDALVAARRRRVPRRGSVGRCRRMNGSSYDESGSRRSCGSCSRRATGAARSPRSRRSAARPRRSAAIRSRSAAARSRASSGAARRSRSASARAAARTLKVEALDRRGKVLAQRDAPGRRRCAAQGRCQARRRLGRRPGADPDERAWLVAAAVAMARRARPRRAPAAARTITMSGSTPTGGAHRRPRVLLPPLGAARRRGSRSSAAGPAPASPTPRAGSSTSASRAGTLAPDDPTGLVFSPIARSGVCLVTNRANPVPGRQRARRSRRSSPGR